MKIFHFSDTHLGLTLENTSRENDFYTNYNFIFDEILRTKPDIVIHTGDLFHTAKPSNKAISVVIDNFLKIQSHNIPFLILAGNHDTPRLSTTTHPFEIFESFENIHSFYKPEIKNIEIKGINFVVLPHIHDENIFKEELKKSSSLFHSNKKNVFLSHFGLSGKEYEDYTDEISGVNITLEDISMLKTFDYVGLGHYHKNFCIGKICYPGSIEHTSFNQKNYKNAYNIIDVSGEKSVIISHSLPTRPMIDLGEVSVDGIQNTQELMEFLQNKIDKKSLENALVKIILTDLTHLLILDFDEKKFLDFFKEAFYFEYKKFKKEDQNTGKFDIKASSNLIYDNFESFFSEVQSTLPPEYAQEIFTQIQQDLKNI